MHCFARRPIARESLISCQQKENPCALAQGAFALIAVLKLFAACRAGARNHFYFRHVKGWLRSGRGAGAGRTGAAHASAAGAGS